MIYGPEVSADNSKRMRTDTELIRALAAKGILTSTDPRSAREIAAQHGIPVDESIVNVNISQPELSAPEV